MDSAWCGYIGGYWDPFPSCRRGRGVGVVEAGLGFEVSVWYAVARETFELYAPDGKDM